VTEVQIQGINLKKSSYSNGGGNCVAAGVDAGSVVIGDTKDHSHVLRTTPEAFAVFLGAVKGGQFDR
jgi:hypothetical protein